MKKTVLLLIFVFSCSLSYADDGATFQEMMKNLLTIAGNVKTISADLKPSKRLYIHNLVPSMKKSLEEYKESVTNIKNNASIELKNKDMLEIVEDMSELQLMSIAVSSELLEVYETNGTITPLEYNNVVKKYEKDVNKITKRLNKHM